MNQNLTFISESSLPFGKRIFRQIWTKLPANTFTFNLGKVFARIFLKPEHQKGALTIQFGNKFPFTINVGEFACNDMYVLDKHYEAETLALWCKLAQNARVIVDIGSQVGLFAMNAAHSQPSAKVIAVEPFPPNIPYLRNNASKHKNVITYEKAIYTSVGVCPMLVDHISGGAVVQTGQNAHANPQSIDVPMVDLSTLSAENNLEYIDLMKLDIEGLEHTVLTHDSDFWTKTPPKNLLVEIAYPKNQPQILTDILEKMSTRGYQYKRIESLYAFPWKESQDLANWHFYQ